MFSLFHPLTPTPFTSKRPTRSRWWLNKFWGFMVWLPVWGLLSPHAQALDYPTRAITIVVGFSAGGSSDVIARLVAEKLSVGLGQPVVVENRPGVGSIVGASFVAHAKPDGYTLLMGASGPLVFNHALYAKLPYAPQDFAPVSLLCTFPLLLLTSSNSPIKNLEDLVQYAKRNPERLNYSASSASFQLASELFNQKLGTRFLHIPYKGSNDSVTAVITGDVSMSLVDAGAASPALAGARVRALAVSSKERLPSMPSVPTLSELGIDLKIAFWTGILAPVGTSQPIVKRLQEEIARVLVNPEIKKRFAALYVIPSSSTPEEFTQLINQEISLWREVARDNHIKAD